MMMMMSKRVVWRQSEEFQSIIVERRKREQKKINDNNNSAPISKHVVVLIPNSASLRGETTVMATASIATKKPPYCNRMPLMRDVIFFKGISPTSFLLAFLLIKRQR